MTYNVFGGTLNLTQSNVRLLLLDTCEESEYFLLPFCYTDCPKHFYAANETTAGGVESRETTAGGVESRAVCLRCHSTCLMCSGPADNECVRCSIHRRLTEGRQCIDVESDHRRVVIIAVVVSMTVVVIIVTALLLWLYLRRRPHTTNRSLRVIYITIIICPIAIAYSMGQIIKSVCVCVCVCLCVCLSVCEHSHGRIS